MAGNPSKPGHIHVPAADLDAGLAARHEVTRQNLDDLRNDHRECNSLDAGERHLFAWLSANKLLPSPDIRVVTADKIALEAAHKLGWLDSMTSLESLLRRAGVGRRKLNELAAEHKEEWLSKVKTRIKLGMLL